ncbi:hypothetical protein P8452_25539 [Trifolium repens]|nr:hypothetical protein P8452_25539 [Trifolium repens]
MTIFTTQMPLLLFLLLSVTTFYKSMSSNDHRFVGCNEKDKETLLIFKKGINDSSHGKISTWSTETNCCSWEGVHCDNITSRVTKLDLSYQLLKGEMNLSILQLEFLSYLDLSENYFDVINIPATLHNITHPSNLFYLDLSFNFDASMDNLDWLSPLSSLKYLNLSYIDLHKESNWLQAVNTLPSLLELELFFCKLNNFIINPSIQYLNLSSLLALDVSGNNFTSQLPNWFFNHTRDLTYLDLYGNNIHGQIPSNLVNLQNLRFLALAQNQLQGSIPNEIGQLTNIQHLDLHGNMLSGSITSTIGNLSSLRYLSMGYNNFSREISENTFSKLSNLEWLDLEGSNFIFQFDLNWVPPFQLHDLLLSKTNQGPSFPSWIYTQKSLQYLDLSSSGISLVNRNKFSSLIEAITIVLDLSNNSMTEDISNLTLKCVFLWMDHNSFTGGLPNILSPMAYVIDLSYNSFSGSIPRWRNLENLVYINLWNNRLSGEVPRHFFDLRHVQAINLGKNYFSGTIPSKMSTQLQVLILRSNQFEGNIPTQLFNLTYLFHLDLAHNKLSGSMPECIYNLTDMVIFHVDSWLNGVTFEWFTKEEENHKTAITSPENEDDDSIKESLYLGMGVGFAAGFWGIYVSSAPPPVQVVILMVKLNRFHKN